MDLQLKLISNLIIKLNAYMKIVNDIVSEINSVINEKKVVGIKIRNSLNSLTETEKKKNINDYNNLNFNISFDTSEKDENLIFNNFI